MFTPRIEWLRNFLFSYLLRDKKGKVYNIGQAKRICFVGQCCTRPKPLQPESMKCEITKSHCYLNISHISIDLYIFFSYRCIVMNYLLIWRVRAPNLKSGRPGESIFLASLRVILGGPPLRRAPPGLPHTQCHGDPVRADIST